ncbi:MAG: hypothetical protein IT198_14825 [Acidimicrobiia bacterium]|nr:hypothetical protein [Acidimicrobiia bacterium]
MDRNSVAITAFITAFIATVVVAAFAALAWTQTSIVAWFLTRTDMVRSPGGAGPLVIPCVLLAIGGIGAVIGAGLLLALTRQWTQACVRRAEAQIPLATGPSDAA